MGKYMISQLATECRLLLSIEVGYNQGDLQTAFFDTAFKLGVSTDMPDTQKLKRSIINTAQEKMRQLKPLEKPLLLKSLCIVVRANEVVEAREGELVRAIAESIDCPMPPLATDTP
jgi:hypothetical protein